MTLYGRKAKIEVEGLFDISDLDVSFSIAMDAKTYNKAEVKVYNLNRYSRLELETAKAVQIAVWAGYEGQQMDRLFYGTMRQVYSQHERPDWVTTFHLGDGDKASTARVSRAYTAGTSKARAWKDIVDQIKAEGLKIGNAIVAYDSDKSFADNVEDFLQGVSFHGSAIHIMREMAKSARLEVTIQDNELVVVPAGQALGASAVYLSPSTGLISTPQKGVDTKDLKGALKARALIIPGLRPLRKVQIKSDRVDGTYRIEKAAYKGDTSSQDWYVDLVCKEVVP